MSFISKSISTITTGAIAFSAITGANAVSYKKDNFVFDNNFLVTNKANNKSSHIKAANITPEGIVNYNIVLNPLTNKAEIDYRSKTITSLKQGEFEKYQEILNKIKVETSKKGKKGKAKPKAKPKTPPRDKTLPPPGDPINYLLYTVQNFSFMADKTGDQLIPTANSVGNVAGSISGLFWATILSSVFATAAAGAVAVIPVSSSLASISSFTPSSIAGFAGGIVGAVVGGLIGTGVGIVTGEVLKFLVGLNSNDPRLRMAAQQVLNAVGFVFGSRAFFPEANI